MSAEAKNNSNDSNDSGKSPDPAEDMVSLVANASNKSSKTQARKSSSDDDNGLMVLLVSGDGRNFELPLEAAKDSGMVREALNLNEDGEFENEEDHQQGVVKKKVDCIRVQSAILEKIVAFLKHNQTERMKDIPLQLPTRAVFEHVSKCFKLLQQRDFLPLVLLILTRCLYSRFLRAFCLLVCPARVVSAAGYWHESTRPFCPRFGCQLHEHCASL